MISKAPAWIAAISFFLLVCAVCRAADAKLLTAIGLLDSLQTNQPRFALPPRENELQAFRQWSAALVQTPPPVIEPLFHAVNAFGGEAAILPAIIISAHRWSEGTEDCFTLLDSSDERMRRAASETIAAVYAEWDSETRSGFGKLDLPLVLQALFVKKGKLSIWAQQAVSSLSFAAEGVLKPEWFEVPPSPPGFSIINAANLSEAAKHSSWNVRFAAVEVALMAKQWTAAAELLEDADERVGLHCAESLLNPLQQVTRLRQPLPVELTTACLRLNSHSDARLRGLAYEHAAALSRAAPTPVGPLFFLQGCDDKHPAVRQAALQSWGRSAIKSLNEPQGQRVNAIATSDNDLGVRAAAIRLIQQRGSNKAKAQLRSSLAGNQDPSIQFLTRLGAGVTPQRDKVTAGTFTVGTNNLILRAGTACTVDKTNDVLVISGEGALLTEQTFNPPFTIHAVAQTDVTNIRLYWAAGVVILNWELNPHELRFHDPETGRAHAFGGRGFVRVNEWHDILWVINPDSSHVIVDGDERAFVRSNNSSLTNSVGIGAARGSTVTVKLLEVQKIRASQ